MIDLSTYIPTNIFKLTSEQKGIYDQILQCVDNQVGGMFFLDAPGGTGKTFLIRLILSSIGSKNDIALALALSGIAATVLPGGRTAHSALKLPLNIQSTESPTCNFPNHLGWVKYCSNATLLFGTSAQWQKKNNGKRNRGHVILFSFHSP